MATISVAAPALRPTDDSALTEHHGMKNLFGYDQLFFKPYFFFKLNSALLKFYECFHILTSRIFVTIPKNPIIFSQNLVFFTTLHKA